MLDRPLAALFKKSGWAASDEDSSDSWLRSGARAREARALFLFLGKRAFVVGNSVIFQKGTQTYIRPRSLATIKESGRGLPSSEDSLFHHKVRD